MPSVSRCFVLLLVLAAVAVPATVWAEEDAPIVLTTDDLERVKSKQEASDAGVADSTLVIVPKRGRDEKRARSAAVWRASGGKGGGAPEGFDAPVTSWQEEYYRLKAQALRQAMERGDPIYFGDPAGPGAAAAGPAAPLAGPSPAKRACIYARDGSLVFAPEGKSCRDTYAETR